MLTEEQQRFIDRLWESARTGSASMYDIGADIGLDRDTARHLGEDLIGREILEIVSLSGAVALTESGRGLTGGDQDPAAGQSDAPAARDAAALIGLAGVTAVIHPLTADQADDLRDLVRHLAPAAAGLEGRPAADMAAHLAALAALLSGPAPGRETVRECLLAAGAALAEGEGDRDTLGRVGDLLTRLWAD